MRRLLDIAIDEISRKLRHGTALAVEALSLVDGGSLEKSLQWLLNYTNYTSRCLT